MKKGKIALFVLFLTVGFLSCNKDDDGETITEVPLRDRTEQQIEDKKDLIEYLTTHYYNAGDFEGNANPKSADLIISKVPESGVLPNATDKVLYTDDGNDANDAVKTEKVTFADTEYEFYILDLNPNAAGKSPKFSDQVRVNYEGFTLDNEVFDSAVTPVDFDLLGLVPGWRKVMPYFKSAESFMSESDGTVSYTNHGVGVMFLPSGLGYFSSSTGGIPSYTSIAFKFDLFQVFQSDHDNDGVPSYLEDYLTNDGEFTLSTEEGVKDDDTDSNDIPDYLDTDDDGDGVPTLNELKHKTYTVDTNQGEEEPVLEANEYERSRTKVNGVITIKTVTLIDDNTDGTFDYLDKNIAKDYLTN